MKDSSNEDDAMDMNVDLQGAHDLQGTLFGDIDMTQAGVAAGGAVGGAGVVPSTSGAQMVVDVDVHVPGHHISEPKKKRDKRDNSISGKGHSSSIDDTVCGCFGVDLCFSFRGGLCFRVLPIAMKPKEAKTKENITKNVFICRLMFHIYCHLH